MTYQEWVAGFKKHYHAVAEELKIDVTAGRDTLVQVSTHPIDSAKISVEFWSAEFGAAGQEALAIKHGVENIYHSAQDWYHNSGAERFFQVCKTGKQAYDACHDTVGDFQSFIKVYEAAGAELGEIALTPAGAGFVALLTVGGVGILCAEMLNAISKVIIFAEEVVGHSDETLKKLSEHIEQGVKVAKVLDPLNSAKERAKKVQEAKESLERWEGYKKKFDSFKAALGPYQSKLKPLEAVGARFAAAVHKHNKK